MVNNRIFTLRDLMIFLGSMILTLGIVALFVEVVGLSHGYLLVIIAMAISSVIIGIQLSVVRKRCKKDKGQLESNLELKNTLYDLMEKASNYEADQDLYNEILSSAIHAMTYGEKGSIVDVRNKDRISYVAVAGFEREILEAMNLKYQDTYLYKETSGKMDHTVVIRNSVNYNQLHSNDELVSSLIEAGTAAVRSTICTPIKVRGSVIGMLNIDSTKKNAFDEKDVEIIELFAQEVGKIIHNHEIAQENIYLSHYDAMTKIYNRGHFYELHRGLFHDEGSSYIFVSTDIDNLKEVNDTFGHSVGDELIGHFVEGVKKFLPENALFGRYGGDEFNILIPEGVTSDVKALMKKISKFFESHPIAYQKEGIFVSFSYGIIRFPDEETDYEQLVIKADQRMYAQKKTMKG